MRIFGKNIAFCALILFASIGLTACGEGWEMVQIKPGDQVPYTQDRTAGYGVAYVRAKMMPKKEMVMRDVVRQDTPDIAPEQPLPPPERAPAPMMQDGNQVLNGNQNK